LSLQIQVGAHLDTLDCARPRRAGAVKPEATQRRRRFIGNSARNAAKPECISAIAERICARCSASTGSAAGIDACLHLVRRDFGARVANMVARRMVTAPHRDGGQAQYVEAPLAARTGRAGRAVGATLDWARRRLDRPISVAELAERSAMSERTLLRHFQASMGMAPRTWLQRARVERARALLEDTRLTHGDIAEQCGFESPETFRVAFRRHMGIAPGAYRVRFSVLRAEK
jgi:transcriptional regulator GlxA family with amidase domain